MDVRIDTVEPSLTAVVAVEPMDLSRIMACYSQNVALYEHDQRMEIGVEVDRVFAPAGPVVSSRLPGGRIAHATHTTGYGDLSRTYGAIKEWCETNGQPTTGIQWEIYSDPDESGHVNVEICFLLR